MCKVCDENKDSEDNGSTDGIQIGTGIHIAQGMSFPCVTITKVRDGKPDESTKVDFPPTMIPALVAQLLEAGTRAIQETKRTFKQDEDTGHLVPVASAMVN